MTRAVYVIGPPGVGKTRGLASAIMLAGYRTGERWARLDLDRWPLLRGHRLYRTGEPVGWVLGVARAEFSGTDGLSMAVHPDAVEWATQADLPDVVVGEGQRLATRSFLHALHEHSHLIVFYLIALPGVLDVRRRQRGRGMQDARWVRGQTAAMDRLAQRLHDDGLAVVPLDTTDLRPANVGRHLAQGLR